MALFDKQTITITFGDVAENHKGMQKIGKLAESGFTCEELKKFKICVEKVGKKCELINLTKLLPKDENEDYPKACILIIRNGINLFVDLNKLWEEQINLEYDTKAFMYGRVVNKHARHNLCFGFQCQEPDYQTGKGRIISFDSLPVLNKIRQNLDIFGKKGENLMAESNFYYDVKKCGIGFHGDSERRIVIALRLGASMPLRYQWFQNNKKIEDFKELILNHGDLYIMSEKATGFDWKRKIIPTLRHAAGCKKFIDN
jgi:hypothetical protein